MLMQAASTYTALLQHFEP